jgi:hypothetical protein
MVGETVPKGRRYQGLRTNVWKEQFYYLKPEQAKNLIRHIVDDMKRNVVWKHLPKCFVY